MRFSERYGYKPIREIIQKESMDDDLKMAYGMYYIAIFGTGLNMVVIKVYLLIIRI